MDWKSKLFRFWNLWPPFFFSGIKLEKVTPDFRYIKVRLKLRFWNANYVGTQYGGSIFSMTDPFYMLMLINNLGPDYIVWDKAANIRYMRPGKSDLMAEFEISEEDVKQIREALESQKSMDWNRTVVIRNKEGTTVAKVEKVLYIGKRERNKPENRDPSISD